MSMDQVASPVRSLAYGRLPVLILTCCLALFARVPAARGQVSPEQTRQEITGALQAWNAACSARDLDRVMAMFDDTPEVMVIGSDRGEVSKGREQIRAWIGRLFRARAFSWEMDRVEIDANGATAWAFVEGRMAVADTAGTVLGKPPYRFTAVMVKMGDAWKWRVFDGAIIGGE